MRIEQTLPRINYRTRYFLVKDRYKAPAKPKNKDTQ